MKRLIYMSSALVLLLTSCKNMEISSVKQNPLAEYSIQDTLIPVRPGGVEGRPFWNQYAIQFIYAPVFDFPEVEHAVSYTFTATDRYHTEHVFSADSPKSALSPIWREIPTGPVTLKVEAVDGNGNRIKTAGTRTFYRGAPFRNSYPSKAKSYKETARDACKYLFHLKHVQSLSTGKPDLSYPLFCYPSKMYSGIIRGMVDYAALEPENREAALKIARGAASYLMEKAVPAGDPLEYLPQTYEGTNEAAGKFGGTIMMLYPATVGQAMLKLYQAAKDHTYLDYAVRIGNQYLKLQQPNGTWYLVLKISDGQPTVKNYCIPTGIMGFLEQLSDITKDETYRIAAQKGLPHLKRMMESFNWEGQFEDVEAQTKPYLNLTKHNATATYLYLCRKDPNNAELIRNAREVQRFAEDQFIIWEQPGWVGKYAPFSWRDPENLNTGKWGWQFYHTPCVLEQYRCYVPVNASSAKLIRYFLMMYDLEKNPLDLAKARALGDALTTVQGEDGRLPTWMNIGLPTSSDWINCEISAIEALRLLDEYEHINLEK